MPYQNILLETVGRIAILTINRPDKRNALNQLTRDEILLAFDELQKSDVRVLVITGAGDKAFIAGADIGEFEGRTALTQRDVMKMRRIFDAVEEFPKPVIAMINGFCLGGGMEFAIDSRLTHSRTRSIRYDCSDVCNSLRVFANSVTVTARNTSGELQ